MDTGKPLPPIPKRQPGYCVVYALASDTLRDGLQDALAQHDWETVYADDPHEAMALICVQSRMLESRIAWGLQGDNELSLILVSDAEQGTDMREDEYNLLEAVLQYVPNTNIWSYSFQRLDLVHDVGRTTEATDRHDIVGTIRPAASGIEASYSVNMPPEDPSHRSAHPESGEPDELTPGPRPDSSDET